ncbi:ATP-binding protein [Streptomyces mirabilis]|uniref:ATP-binding protein n=1 Tax=Streptomyces mirabilis TaxID=68239 RepID=UPI003716B22D
MSSTAMHHGFRVISTAEHVPLARRETAKVLADWGMSKQVVDTACLIISELVTNVVRHAAVLSPTATVTLAVEEQTRLVLAVADARPGHRQRRQADRHPPAARPRPRPHLIHYTPPAPGAGR